MSNILKNTMLWWAWLWVVEYFSNWKVSQVMWYVKDKIAWVISWDQFVLNEAFPIAWSLVPFALGWYWVYKWIQETKNTNIYNWVERWLLTYGVSWTITTSLWLLSIPWATWILATWAWMYWVKKITSAIADGVSSIKWINPWEMVVKWIKWLWNWVKNIISNK